MPKRRLWWQLLPSFGLIALTAVLAVGWIAVNYVEDAYLAAERGNLRAQAEFLIRQLGEMPIESTAFAALCRRYSQASGTRVAVILPDSKIAFDSSERPLELENQRSHPEIQQAQEGRAQDIVRDHPGLERRVLDMAVPIGREGPAPGVIYMSSPLTALDRKLSQMRTAILLVGAAMIALAVPVAWRAAAGIVRPLDRLREAAGRLAGGQWASRAPVPDPKELAESAEAFNHMADLVQERIRVLVQNNNEQKAVLASMAEGVLAVDGQERLISMNPASSRLLGLDPTQAQGRRLQEVVRNADLSRFITRALACPDPVEADVLLHGDRERVMQAHGSALHDLDGRAIGAVIVLNDVTDFRRLESIRRDFVANVSHELKTPVTSIKGFVETLLDGAMQDPVNSERFLRIVAKQADRLHAIIEDLLSLSKIEQSEDADDIALESLGLRGVLEAALAACRSTADEKNIRVTLDCDSQLTARINPLLLEQAIVNLLDNACKYSDANSQVRLWAAPADREVSIHVTDRGCGIASEHLSRVFERFYRVDRARSRKLGGTGLGLAIVKHIVQAHHGRVTVESTLGVGSTFSVHLPGA